MIKTKLVISTLAVSLLVFSMMHTNVKADDVVEKTYENELVECLIENGDLEDREYSIKIQKQLDEPTKPISDATRISLADNNINVFDNYSDLEIKQEVIELYDETNPNEKIYVSMVDLDNNEDDSMAKARSLYYSGKRDFEKQSVVYVVVRANYSIYPATAATDWGSFYRPVGVAAKWTTLSGKKSAYVEMIKGRYICCGLYYDTATWKTVNNKDFIINSCSVSEYMPDEGVYYTGTLAGMPTNRVYVTETNGLDTYSHIYLKARYNYNGKTETIEDVMQIQY